jgi:hypothetical protein
MMGLFAVRRDAEVVAYAVWSIGVVLAIAGLTRPASIRLVYRGLLWVTYPIGWIVSYVILLFLYYGVITPIGLLVRMFYDPLGRAFDTKSDSYWFPRESPESRRYFRQF